MHGNCESKIRMKIYKPDVTEKMFHKCHGFVNALIEVLLPLILKYQVEAEVPYVTLLTSLHM